MNKKKGENPMGIWAKDLNKYFTNQNIQMANACEQCSDSLVTRKIQNKTTKKCHYPLTRMAIMKKIDSRKCG